MGTAASSLVTNFWPISKELVDSIQVSVPAGILIERHPIQELQQDPEIQEKLAPLLAPFDPDDPNEGMIRSFKLSKLIRHAELADRLKKELHDHYQDLVGGSDDASLIVRLRSKSPLDSPTRAQGFDSLQKAIQKLYAEHFANLVIDTENSQTDLVRAPELVIQQAPQTESTGLAFSYDPKSKNLNFATVYATWGIAEDILRRTLARDEYLFQKHPEAGIKPIFHRVGQKEFQLQYDPESRRMEHLPLSRYRARKLSLSRQKAEELAQAADKLEERLGSAVEITWSSDGETVHLLALRAVPKPSPTSMKFYRRTESAEPLLTGQAQGHAVASGRVRVINQRADLEEFKPGEIFVAEKTEPDWEPTFRNAAAIVTERDRRVSHSSILAREMGIPAIIGCVNAPQELSTGQTITVSCCQGQVGQILSGRVEHQLEEFSLTHMPDLNVDLMVNLSLPERALSAACLPWSGAGLVRSEFMIGGWVKIHPLALLNPGRLPEPTRDALDRLCAGYETFTNYYLTKMTQGIALFASAFWPRPVNIRLSDFKSNEYARLLGGEQFEPKEKHPMLGWRGAGRFLDPDFRAAMELEFEAIRRVRDDLGLTNIRITIPFCRTPEEGEEMLELLSSCGLKQGSKELEVWVMAELPSNVVLASEFAQLFDGFSIGSSDLTSLTLGIARNSETIMDDFDELHPAMMKSYETIIQAGRDRGKRVAFCGQIASQDPESAALLAEMGVDILSLAPDALHPTLERLRS